MNRILRFFIIVLSLAEIIKWAVLIWLFHNPWRGAAAGAPSASSTPDAKLLTTFLLVAVWLVLASPYFCMIAGSLHLITGKPLEVAYRYSLAMLALITLLLVCTGFHTVDFMILGNIVAGALWFSFFRKTPSSAP